MMKYVIATKLLIINILIAIFAYYLHDLIKHAIEYHDSATVIGLATALGAPIIGLLSLEIHLIYKHLLEMLKHKHAKELQNNEKK